jgi:hypothetical protein
MYEEQSDMLSRTTEDNSNHLVPSSLESDPAMYKAVVVGDRSETMRNIQKGYRLAISINIKNFNVYIGSDHLNMQANANISAENLCAGFARLDMSTGHIVVEDFADWRNGIKNEYEIKKAIAIAIQRDLIK